MAELRAAAGIIELLTDLARQLVALAATELALMRVELSQSSSRALVGVAKVVVGGVFLLAAFFFVLAAVTAFLVRLGAPVDLSCLIVAVAASVAGGLILRSGARAFQPENLLPRRSLAQISSIIRRP
jgi:hypothetical protein